MLTYYNYTMYSNLLYKMGYYLGQTVNMCRLDEEDINDLVYEPLPAELQMVPVHGLKV